MLSKDRIRNFQLSERETYPVASGVHIFLGAAVGCDSSGYARPLIDGDKFLGFSFLDVDNSNGVAGAKKVGVKTRGRIVLDVPGAILATNERSPVYAISDNDFSFVSGTLIGYVSHHVLSEKVVVEFRTGLLFAAEYTVADQQDLSYLTSDSEPVTIDGDYIVATE